MQGCQARSLKKTHIAKASINAPEPKSKSEVESRVFGSAT
jgi:hypothetical protein